MGKTLNFIVLVSFLTGLATLNSCSDKEKIFIQFSNEPTGIPTITTSYVRESITATSVIAEANIISEGDAPVTERGFETSIERESETSTVGGWWWRKRENLDYRLSGTDRFTQEITGLWPGRTYHIRAYATNSVGTGHGITWVFTTLAKPVVTTDLVTVLSQTAASVVGSVTKMSSSDIAERGICYGTDLAPTTEGFRVIVPTNEVGTSTCNLQNLIPGTHYYVRAYVCIFSDDGWLQLIPFYGKEITFVAGDHGSVL
jgi:hypothetical protein